MMQFVSSEDLSQAAPIDSVMMEPVVLGSALVGDDGADVVGLEPAATADKPNKPSKQARRNARAQGKSKAKAVAKTDGEKKQDDESRGLGDVAAFGMKETEDGLDAFDSFAISGQGTRLRIKKAEKFKDIVLPDVFVGIVTDSGQKDLICG